MNEAIKQTLAGQARIYAKLVKNSERLQEIRKRVAERDDSQAFQSACGEYNCPCHYDIEFLLELLDGR